MRNVLAFVVLVCVAISGLALAKGKAQSVTLSASEMKYGPVPPVLPAGAQLAVLHGDPFKKGSFALRLKMPDGYRIPPHWHTNDEELTVVSGAFQLGMGDKEGDGDVHTLEAGSYHFLPAKAHHYAQAKGDTVLELHGPGPFDIHYLNAADDPAKNASAAK